MLPLLDNWKQKNFLQIITIYLRYLIGGAFIIAAFGMGKVSGTSNLMSSMDHPIQDLQPIQQFFRVMTDSGLYWKFIGWTQIIAGALLMTQHFARLGALIFFGLILNIFVITIAYDFKGTPVVTGLLLLAATWLLIWDLRSLQVLVRDNVELVRVPLNIMDSAYWMWLGVIMIVSIISLAVFTPNLNLELGVPFLEGLIGFVAYFMIRKRNVKNEQRVTE
jgi:uncharacterized membrane protein YphA (DoxX/SURF4 family)